MKQARVSVLTAVSGRYGDVGALHARTSEALGEYDCDFIYVLDGPRPEALAVLRELRKEGHPIQVVQLARWFGEATAVSAGLEYARGDIIMTLPAYEQVEPAHLPRVIEALDDADLAVGRRSPRVDTGFNQFQASLFNGTVKWLTDTNFTDLGCAVRAVRREVMQEITLYGDQLRFLPLLADRSGFRTVEVDLAQSTRDSDQRIYGPGVYLRRALDVLSILFLVKFTKKPLRFFGLVGTSIASVGAMALLYLVVQRAFGLSALADRPALLLSSLMVVLGLQLLALGLLGELIIYTHARDIKDYTVQQVVGGEPGVATDVQKVVVADSTEGVEPGSSSGTADTRKAI